MFRVTQEIDFCYGHRLLNYAGKCRHLHGHNGRAVITLQGEHLDDRGMLVDFSDIKASLRTWIDDALDHRMLLNERDPIVEYLRQQQEPLYLLPVNPTAENIAKLIFDYAQQQQFPVIEVTVWETPKSFATYFPHGSGAAALVGQAVPFSVGCCGSEQAPPPAKQSH